MESSIITDRSISKRPLNQTHHTKNSLSESCLRFPSSSILQEQIRDYLKKDQEKLLPKLKLKHSRDVSYIRDLKFSKSHFNPISLPKSLHELKTLDTCRSFAQLSSLCNKSSCISEILTSRPEPKSTSVKYLQSLNKSLPSGRKEAENLLEWFKSMKNDFENDQDFEIVIWKCAEELCRQITVECKERGELFKIVFGYFQDIFDAKNEDIKEYCENYENQCKKKIIKLQALHFEEMGKMKAKVEEALLENLQKDAKIERAMQEGIIYKQKFYDMRRELEIENKRKKSTVFDKGEGELKVEDYKRLKRSHKTQKSPDLSFNSNIQNTDINNSFHASALTLSVQVMEISKQQSIQTDSFETSDKSIQINPQEILNIQTQQLSSISLQGLPFIIKKLHYDKSVQVNQIVPSLIVTKKFDNRQRTFNEKQMLSLPKIKEQSLSFIVKNNENDSFSSSESDSDDSESEENEFEVKAEDQKSANEEGIVITQDVEGVVKISEYNLKGAGENGKITSRLAVDKPDKLTGKRRESKIITKKGTGKDVKTLRKSSVYLKPQQLQSAKSINPKQKPIKNFPLLSIPSILPKQKSKSFLITTSFLPDVPDSHLLPVLEAFEPPIPAQLSPINSLFPSHPTKTKAPNPALDISDISKNNSVSILEDSASSYDDLFSQGAGSPSCKSNLPDLLKSFRKKLNLNEKLFSIKVPRLSLNRIMSKFIQNLGKNRKSSEFNKKLMRKTIYSAYSNSVNFDENLFKTCVSGFSQQYGLKKVAEKKIMKFLVSLSRRITSKTYELFLRLAGLAESVKLKSFSEGSKRFCLDTFRAVTQHRYHLALFDEGKLRYYTSCRRVCDFIKVRFDCRCLPGTLAGFYENKSNELVGIEKVLLDLTEFFELYTVGPIGEGIEILYSVLDYEPEKVIEKSKVERLIRIFYPKKQISIEKNEFSSDEFNLFCIQNLIFSISDLQKFTLAHLKKSSTTQLFLSTESQKTIDFKIPIKESEIIQVLKHMQL